MALLSITNARETSHSIIQPPLLFRTHGRLLPGGKKGGDQCREDESVDAQCCVDACDLECSSTCVITKDKKDKTCVCNSFIGGLGSSGTGISNSVKIFLLFLVNSILGIVVLTRFVFPMLRAKEEHLPEELSVVDSKKSIAIILTFALGVVGAGISYVIIGKGIQENTTAMMSVSTKL